MKFKILLFLIFAILLHNTIRNGDPTKFFVNAYYKEKYSDEFNDNIEEANISYKNVIDEIEHIPKNIDPKPKAPTQYVVPKSTIVYSPDVEGIFEKKVSEGGKFVWGHCTWFVAQYRKVDWRGNARNWYKNAEAKGHPVGKIPVVGSIVVFYGKGFSKYGHVAIVTKVTTDTIFIKDMNNPGLNVISDHELSIADTPITGYIYSDEDTQNNLITYLKRVIKSTSVQ